tara:strand:- start:157 stop:456 length:300 start_codon:yes stop_codon:yes gene_type:complete
MPDYKILDADGNITNTIIADSAFIEANFEHYELIEDPVYVPPTAEVTARMWRDAELSSTDTASQTPDWPNRDNILLYRTALRNWPSTSDFPATRPTLGE